MRGNYLECWKSLEDLVYQSDIKQAKDQTDIIIAENLVAR